jgi:Flp pilus assembly protein TadG
MRNLRDGSDRGQSLVEFALIVPIFVLVLLGLFDLGRAVYAYNTVQNASREAVRVAIVDQNASVVEDKAVQAAVGLGIDPVSGVDLVIRQPDFATGGVGTCSADPDLGCVAEVTVRYQYSAATPIISNLLGTIQMQGLTRQPIERVYESP